MKYILAVLFAVVMIGIIFWCLDKDIRYAKLYKKVSRSEGVVIGIIKTERVHFYSLCQWRIYTRVMVRFSAAGRVYEEELLLRGKNIQPGKREEIHYFLDREGKMFVLNDICTRRLQELVIAILIAIPFSGILLFLKMQGVF